MAVELNKQVDFAIAKDNLIEIYKATIEALHICDIALFSGKPESIPPGNQILANFFATVEPTQEQIDALANIYKEAAINVKAMANQLMGGEINE